MNKADPTCGGQGPCYGTIQAAVTAAGAGDTITIQAAGTYVEQVVVQNKNNTSGASELNRIVIQADPAAPAGAVVLSSAAETCGGSSVKVALQFKRSKYITVRGLTILGNGGIGVQLLGTGDKNEHIRLERLRVVGTGSSCSQGVQVLSANVETLVANSVIYGHGKDGVRLEGQNGGRSI